MSRDDRDYQAEISQILDAVNADSPGAEARLMELVYGELKRIAAARLKGAAPDQSLSPTALVSEAYVKLFGNKNVNDWTGRGHFFSAAARAMRQIVCDHAKTKRRLKRGGDRLAIDLDVSQLPNLRSADIDKFLDVDRALTTLGAEDEKLVELVELKFFGGHTTEEIATILGISIRTANRQWQYAKARLAQLLDSPIS